MTDSPREKAKGRDNAGIELEVLLRENLRLKRELLGERGEMEKAVREGRERAERVESRVKRLREKLLKCIQKKEPRKFRAMAELMELGHRRGGFVPAIVAKDLGIKASMVYEYLRELTDIGMLERPSRGYYRPKEEPREGLEEEISWRLAGRKGGG
jgi:hypothetical protein